MVMPQDAPVNIGAWTGTPAEAAGRVVGIQAKLHGWAAAEPGRRFDDLFNLVADPAFMLTAWMRVQGNTGARSAGIDRRSGLTSPDPVRTLTSAKACRHSHRSKTRISRRTVSGRRDMPRKPRQDERPDRKSVKTARRYRTIRIQAGPRTIAADPLPDELRQALDAINRPG